MAKIFLTGASGYIGGDLLYQLAQLHPEYRVRALVRDEAKGEALKKAFSQVEVIKGSLDDGDLISQEARNADIVLHLAATGHLPSVQSIHKALADTSSGGKPRYWIQIGGGSLLAAAELAGKSWVPGTGSGTVFDDLSDIEALRALIKNHPNRAVDNYILSVAESTPHVKTASIPGPIIYGEGRGPGNRRSVQVPELAKVTLQRKKGLQVGEGLSRWGNVHVRDLSRLLLRLVGKAVDGDENDEVWGSNGFYLAGVGEQSFGELSQRVADVAYDLNLIPTRDLDKVNQEEADRLLPHGSVLFGTNARGRPNRAQAVLGWEPQEEGLENEVRRVVVEEARALDLLPV